MNVWSTMSCIRISLRKPDLGKRCFEKSQSCSAISPKLTMAIKNNTHTPVGQKSQTFLLFGGHLLFAWLKLWLASGRNPRSPLTWRHLWLHRFLTACEIIPKTRQSEPWVHALSPKLPFLLGSPLLPDPRPGSPLHTPVPQVCHSVTPTLPPEPSTNTLRSDL